jgi:predicted dehydrogenase
MSTAELVGVLYGHGHMGRLHASKLTKRPDVTLHIVDPNKGQQPSLPRSFDFAVIATPTRNHASIAEPLLARGIPCLIEKPLSNVLFEAERLASHDHLAVGHIERFNPVFVPINGIQPEFIEIQRLAPFSDRSTDLDVIDDLMIHDLDVMLQLLPGEITDLRAKGIGVLTQRPDIVNVRLEISRPNAPNAVVSITASRVSEKTVRTWRIVEPTMYWSLDLEAQTAKKVTWLSGKMVSENVPVPTTDALTAEHDAFLTAVRGAGPYTASGADALAALQLAQRIRECLV